MKNAHFFLFSLVCAFLLLFVLGGAMFYFARAPVLPHYPPKEAGEFPSEKNILPEEKEKTVPSSPDDSKTIVVPEDEFRGNEVSYTLEGFSPKRVKVERGNTDGMCLIKILNRTDQPLLIRLSPHHPKDDWGFPYPPIAAQHSSIIDPRYRIATIAFHNHERPEKEFSVVLDPGCAL